MDFIDYRKKLGIGFDDDGLENLFFHRIFNVLDDLCDMSNQISEWEYCDFCMQTGYPMRSGSVFGEGWDIIMNVLHSNDKSIKEFLSYYMFMINCQEDSEYKSLTKENLKNIVCDCMRKSHIPFEVYEESGGCFVFPKGAKELDDALVSEPLEWLKDYPQAHKTYCTALKQYSDGEYIRDTADNLRKSLEDFLREFLKNDKDMNKNKKEVEDYLKSQNADPQLIAIFGAMINHYYLQNNDVAKHKDKIDKKYLEFLLYQTGVLIRMLITIKKAEEDE